MHIILIISLVAIGLSIFCMIKQEKYNFLYQDNNNNIGLRAIDIDQKIDDLRNEFAQKYVSYSEPIAIKPNNPNNFGQCLNSDVSNRGGKTTTSRCGVYAGQDWFIIPYLTQ